MRLCMYPVQSTSSTIVCVREYVAYATATAIIYMHIRMYIANVIVRKCVLYHYYSNSKLSAVCHALQYVCCMY